MDFPSHISVHLEHAGFDSFIIGLNTTVGMLSVIMFAPLYPRLMLKFGYRNFSALVFGLASQGTHG